MADAADPLTCWIFGFDPFSMFLDQKQGFRGPGVSPMHPDLNFEPYPRLNAQIQLFEAKYFKPNSMCFTIFARLNFRTTLILGVHEFLRTSRLYGLPCTQMDAL